MLISDYISQVTKLIPFEWRTLVDVREDASGNCTIVSWDASLPPQPTAAEIIAALAAPEPGPSVATLTAYAEDAQQTILAKGLTFNVAASGSAAINILSDGTNSTRADLALLALFGQANPTGSKSWLDNNGVVTVLSGSELVTLATLVGSWISNTYTALSQLMGEITASSPTVTTTAEIDSFSWPTA